MKEIRLKPTLEVGEEVICNKIICIVEEHNSVCVTPKDISIVFYRYLLKQIESGYKFWIIYPTADIIESPDEPKCKHLSVFHGKCHSCGFSVDGRNPNECIDSLLCISYKKHIERLQKEKECQHDFTSSIADEGTGCYICKHCGAQPTQEEFEKILRKEKLTITEANLPRHSQSLDFNCFSCGQKVIKLNQGLCILCEYHSKEKPPLKLRVGEVYRNRNGIIRGPMKYGDNPILPWTDGQLFSCKSDGTQYQASESTEDLIEEVQEENQAICDNCETELSWLEDRLLCVKCEARTKPTVAVKETEIIPLGKYAGRQIDEPILQCQNCFEVNLLCSPWKWCRSHSLIYRDDFNSRGACPACLTAESKPSGNPFKVGETVYCYVASITPWVGKTTQIDGDLLRITLCEHKYNRGSINYGDSILAHYKQCELV